MHRGGGAKRNKTKNQLKSIRMNTSLQTNRYKGTYHRTDLSNAIIDYVIYKNENVKEARHPNLEKYDFDFNKAVEAILNNFIKRRDHLVQVIFYDRKTIGANGYMAELGRYYSQHWRQVEYFEKVWKPAQLNIAGNPQMLDHAQRRNQLRLICENYAHFQL
jgi:hypothetical protein